MSMYYKAAQAVYSATQAALTTILEALNQGQQNKLMEDATVAALLSRYGAVPGSESQ